MAQSTTVSRDTKLSKLQGQLTPVCGILNMNRHWEKLAAILPNRQGQLKFPEDWQRAAIADSGNPTEQLLLSMRHDNRSVIFLLTLLEEAELFRAADYIRLDILNEPPIERPDSAPPRIPENVPDHAVTDEFPPPKPEDTRIILDREGADLPLNIPPLPTFEIGSTIPVPYAGLQQMTDDFSMAPMEHQNGHCGWIADGGFADVFFAKAADGMQLAIKRMKDNSALSNKQFETEVMTLAGVKHPNILPVLGYSMDGPHLCIVYKFAPLGCLKHRLECRNNTRPLLVHIRISIAKQTAEAIHFLHSGLPQPLIHRDISSSNILLDVGHQVLLGDFGLVKQGPDQSSGQTHMTVTSVVGVQVYMPIEAPYVITTKQDVYAYGLVLLEILTGLKPYDDEREAEEKNLKGYVFNNCDDISELLDESADKWSLETARNMKAVSDSCLQHDRRSRPEMAEIMEQIRSWPES